MIDAGKACAAYHDEHVRGLATKRVQVDEIWSFTYSKQKNVAGAKSAPDWAGDTWTWTGFGYVLVGSLYVGLGILYLTRNAGWLMRSFGPSLSRLSTVRGSAALAMFFGLNIPACSGPLLAAVLSSAAVAGSSKVGQGFWMLALFGFALSLPLLVAVAFGPAQQIVERLGEYSKRAPLAIGALFVALGGWSIWFGLMVSLKGG